MKEMKYTLKFTDPAGITTDIDFKGTVPELEVAITKMEQNGGFVGTVVSEDGRTFHKIEVKKR